jgi:hypothetical protein
MNPGGYVAFTLYVGAAFREANRDQRSLLRTKLRPLIERMRQCSNDPREWGLVAHSIFININRIMGANWSPNEEWSRQIKLLLGRPDPLEERTAKARNNEASHSESEG